MSLIFKHLFNFDNINHFTNNQSVKIFIANLDIGVYCGVRSRQDINTPGIRKNNINVEPNSNYKLEVSGFSEINNCLLWAIDNNNGTHIMKVKKYLNTFNSTVSVELKTLQKTKSISIGVLFTNPNNNEDFADKTFYIKSIKLYKINFIDNEQIQSQLNLNIDSNQTEDINKIKQEYDFKIQKLNKINFELNNKIKKIEEAQQPFINSYPLVSIIMTAYNSEKYIHRAIDSILAQTYKNIELIIVDDCSTDDTFNILLSYSKKDIRIKPLYCQKNMGTYCAKNYGITKSRGEFIALQDSDDISLSNRIETQLNILLSDKNLIASCCNYERRDKKNNIVMNRGLKSRLGLICILFRKSVIDEMGYFDSVRIGADDEFVERLKKKYGRKRMKNITDSLYISYSRKGSLSNSNNKNKIDISKNKDFLSNNRKLYAESYNKWHKKVVEDKTDFYISYPLLERRFDAPLDIIPNKSILKKKIKNKEIPGSSRNYVTVSMCSIFNRINIMNKTIESLLPQVDKINVYLNNYLYIPKFLLHEKITVSLSQHYGDLNDTGKFFFNIPTGYHFTVDDDILYPPDYVQKMIMKIELYQKKAIICVHGTILPDDIKHFFSKNRTTYSFKKGLNIDKFIHIPGTGTVAYHTSTFSSKCNNVEKYAGLIDIWLAIIAKKNNVPIISIEREDGWLKYIGIDDITLYNKYMKKNVKKIINNLCLECKKKYDNNKYNLCLECDKLFERVKDNKHTKYLTDMGSWKFTDNKLIYNNIADHFLVKQYLDTDKLLSNGIDVNFLKNMLDKKQLKIVNHYNRISQYQKTKYLSFVFKFNIDNISDIKLDEQKNCAIIDVLFSKSNNIYDIYNQLIEQNGIKYKINDIENIDKKIINFDPNITNLKKLLMFFIDDLSISHIENTDKSQNNPKKTFYNDQKLILNGDKLSLSNKPVSESFNEPSNKPVSEPFNEPSNEPVSEPFNEPVSDLSDDSLCSEQQLTCAIQ